MPLLSLYLLTTLNCTLFFEELALPILICFVVSLQLYFGTTVFLGRMRLPLPIRTCLDSITLVQRHLPFFLVSNLARTINSNSQLGAILASVQLATMHQLRLFPSYSTMTAVRTLLLHRSAALLRHKKFNAIIDPFLHHGLFSSSQAFAPPSYLPAFPRSFHLNDGRQQGVAPPPLRVGAEIYPSTCSLL
ncbi:hypothetical protein CC80DRAFT_178123 [Byssothecium circinans]|uniref:Uncharacterized protein n=1 Tax=Byssothecium circinans TaxID=147558 RepID=A0A6A5TIW3_9PLEO|nr:hypothetical protein CC80DRAFT_178123 [Byssothecium circinans]